MCVYFSDNKRLKLPDKVVRVQLIPFVEEKFCRTFVVEITLANRVGGSGRRRRSRHVASAANRMRARDTLYTQHGAVCNQIHT